MEKHYIAPSLTVVSIHVERGYAESIIAANGETDKNFLYSLSKTDNGCTGATESRDVSDNWDVESGGFWSTTFN